MHHPLLYQLNTRAHLCERSLQLGRPASFEDIPASLLDQLKEFGFEWLYLLGVWQTGPAARTISRANAHVWAEGEETLANFCSEDIIGSPFAIQAYRPNPEFGGTPAFERLRKRAHSRGLKVMLDFVPNHIAPDHEWVFKHPEYLISGSKEDLSHEPHNWGRFETPAGPRVFAFGRDPYFPGWEDTVQLNYRHPQCRKAMLNQLAHVAELCDGVRCDMAMLIEPDIFMRTWGDRSMPRDGVASNDSPFWPEAIATIHKKRPSFAFMAEVYWDMEWRLQQEGFDFTYDKRLYDRLRENAAIPVREHLLAGSDFQNHSARFLENHDEPRVSNVFSRQTHFPAALITFFVPGLRFFHESQMEGCCARASMHLGRRRPEQINPEVYAFYESVLKCLRRPEVHEGQFRLWQPRPAWNGNPTWNNFVCFSWHDDEGHCSLIAVNYSPSQSQCYVQIDLELLAGGVFRLSDLFSTVFYDRSGDELRSGGLYLDLPPWGYHFFQVAPIS